MSQINNRIAKLRSTMQAHQLDGFLVSKPENIRYLSDFTSGSEALLVITQTACLILTDGRFYEQAEQECPDWELVKVISGGPDALVQSCKNIKRLGVEGHYITLAFMQRLQKDLSADLIPFSDWIEMQRLVKEEDELNNLRRAAEIGDRVFTQICQEIREGVSERHIAAKIAFLLKEGGCSGESFDTIAVSGDNSALPHGKPSSRELCSGDMMTMDFGGFYEGYAGDMTRTVTVKEASQKFQDIYGILLEAQKLGVASVQAGVKAQEVDLKVRNYLKKFDLDRHFLHSLGHGVGLEIHEAPRLSTSSDDILEENMVVTVEPGVYLPGWGGIRIEDSVIVKNGGCEVITHSDKKLIIL